MVRTIRNLFLFTIILTTFGACKVEEGNGGSTIESGIYSMQTDRSRDTWVESGDEVKNMYDSHFWNENEDVLNDISNSIRISNEAIFQSRTNLDITDSIQKAEDLITRQLDRLEEINYILSDNDTLYVAKVRVKKDKAYYKFIDIQLNEMYSDYLRYDYLGYYQELEDAIFYDDTSKLRRAKEDLEAANKEFNRKLKKRKKIMMKELEENS